MVMINDGWAYRLNKISFHCDFNQFFFRKLRKLKKTCEENILT